jgi:OOP family OmpA-OmpF porin
MLTRYTIALLAVLPAAVSAQTDTPRTFYAGADLGRSDAKRWCVGAGSASCDDTSTAVKIFGGYQLDETFAVEVGYANLGKFKASFPGATDEAKVSALEASIVATWHLAPRFSLFGRFGGYYGTVKETTSFAGSFEDSKGDLTFGVGVRYDLTPKVAVRAQWQRYLDMGGANVALGAGAGDLSSVDVLGVGFFWRFQ